MMGMIVIMFIMNMVIMTTIMMVTMLMAVGVVVGMQEAQASVTRNYFVHGALRLA